MRDYVKTIPNGQRRQVKRKGLVRDLKLRPCLRCEREFMASIENRLCPSCNHSSGEYGFFRGGE